jgi:hypothetical protein
MNMLQLRNTRNIEKNKKITAIIRPFVEKPCECRRKPNLGRRYSPKKSLNYSNNKGEADRKSVV